MRIDKLLCELNIGTRSQVKDYVKKGLITVNDQIISRSDDKIDELTAIITYKGKKYCYKPFVYYMLNKPAGYITATTDSKERTVLDLFKELYCKQNDGALSGIQLNDIFPVGRLDKDTVGLLLLTNNGELAHKLLSPVSHVAKKYYVETDDSLSAEKILMLEHGVEIGPDEITRPAVIDSISECKCNITITEGKYHQIKRMFKSVGLTVTYLKRISMGSLILDKDLPEGQMRELTLEEVNALC